MRVHAVISRFFVSALLAVLSCAALAQPVVPGGGVPAASPTFSGIITLNNGSNPLTLQPLGPSTVPSLQEYVFTTNVLGNVLALQNNNSAGFPALTFRNYLGYESGAVGNDQGGGGARPAAGVFTGSITGTTMTVTAKTSGSIAAGNRVDGTGVTTSPATTINSQLTNTGAAGTGTITNGNILTITAATTATYAVGTRITGTGVAANTMIVRLISGTGGTGTYAVLPLGQAVSSTAITEFGGVGTYQVNQSQNVSSTTLTFNGQNSGNSSATNTFIEASNLNGEPVPSTLKFFQTYGNPAVQYTSMMFDTSQNWTLDGSSGGGGNIMQSQHTTGFLGIGGTVSGWAPTAAVDVYLGTTAISGANQCMIVGHNTSNRGSGFCGYGANPTTIGIADPSPQIAMFSASQRVFLFLDDAGARFRVFDPQNGASAGPADFYVNGTFTTSLRGPTWYTGTVKTTPTTGSTVTFATTQRQALIVPAGTLATLTVTLPACAAANDGDERNMVFSQIVTALTVGASAGSVIGAPAAAAVGVGQVYHCYGADTTWYKI